MKKKIREITVDGKTYVWMCGGGYYKDNYLRVFLDKKEIIYQELRTNSITPKIVAEAIEIYNYQQKNEKFTKKLLIEKMNTLM